MTTEPLTPALLQQLRDAFERQADMPWDRVHLLGYMGSIAHGTHTPSEDPDSIDDIDLMGIVIPPPERTLGLSRWEHTVVKEGALDATFYSLTKACSLLAKGNPNITSLLWLKSAMYVHASGLGYQLLRKRMLFSTLACYDAFVHYANDQLQRMSSCLPEDIATYESIAARLHAGDVERVLDASNDRMLDQIATENMITSPELREFRRLHRKHYLAYMGAKRKSLVRKHGWDVKNGAHLIRLMRMCCEFLGNGEFVVDRSGLDAAEIRAIKQGAWSLEQVQQEAAALFRIAEYRKAKSMLPQGPDTFAISGLAAALTRSCWAMQDEIGPPTLSQQLDEAFKAWWPHREDRYSDSNLMDLARHLAPHVPAIIGAFALAPVKVDEVRAGMPFDDDDPRHPQYPGPAYKEL